MNSESKTTEDILRKMREYADQLDNDGDITGADFRDFANQLEEAMKREKAVTDALLACKDKMTPHPDPEHAPPPYPGNAAAKRNRDADPEPLSAILASFRAFALRAAKEDKMISPESILLLADKAEAAVERERIQRDTVSFRCGDCARFGGDCDAGDSDGNDDRIACEKFVRRAIVPGNAAALRDALESTEELLEHFAKPGTMLHNAFFLHMRDNRAALAAPPRNCDVGTAEEQEERFREFCRRHEAAGECGIGRTRAKCPCWCGPKNPDCALAWAQMPYEEGGAE